MQAVDTAVAAAVADARVKTKEEVEAASAAKKAAADQQLLRELEDKTEALTSQVNAATEQLRSTETALKSAHIASLMSCWLCVSCWSVFVSQCTGWPMSVCTLLSVGVYPSAYFCFVGDYVSACTCLVSLYVVHNSYNTSYTTSGLCSCSTLTLVPDPC